MAEVLTRTGEGWRLLLHIQPGARRNEICGPHGDALKIRIQAPAREGRANRELIRFLAGRLDVSGSDIRIASGAGSRRKSVILPDLPRDRLLQALQLSDT